MPSYQFDWVDAFTDVPFGGNGCAVVHDAAAIPAETCKAYVRETSLVECTFLEPSDRADLKVRYFIAAREIPFAGHPTIASVASMVNRGVVSLSGPRTEITIETGAGIIPITIEAGDTPRIRMTQKAPQFGECADPELVAAVVGLTGADIAQAPQFVSTGLPFCITVLRDHEALRRARMDPEALERFRAASAIPDADVMEPYLVTTTGVTEQGATFSRLLLAPPHPAEDAFTGSATGCTGAYLWHHGLIDSPSYTAEQGHWMGRPGRAEVSVLGPRDAITGVEVAGTGVILMEGTLTL
ncbi:MAG: PhzF family phenazine biosynthesis protein [Pseudomonadota bacterium]